MNNQFDADFSLYAKDLFERAIDREIAVIGVTDYFTIRGFRELREIQRDESKLIELLGDDGAAKAKEILLLANVELRLSDIVKAGDHETRVNLHVIFAESLPADEIEKRFLHQLPFLSDSAPDDLDEQLLLTEDNLALLGARLKEQHGRFRDASDLRVGMEQAVVSHQAITNLLARTKVFSKRHVLVLAADDPLSKINWDGPGHLSRKTPIQKAHMLFSANPKTREFGLGAKHATADDFLREFKTFKPCIHGSDAHKPDDLFVFAEDRQLWVRADPTFNGLTQLLLAPEDRVYVGLEPPALARAREAASKTIDSVELERVPPSDPKAQWFSGSLPLNGGLVAVIGKKGSGKSALAEAVALAGNTRNGDYFSFLTRDRFLSRPEKLGDQFSVVVNW
ncbi:MAG TPA: hypothetical protein VHU79_05560, partial [Sphingomicrobium sp.]|nr:hypothetical protein [Sphingomicrobium sp.]